MFNNSKAKAAVSLIQTAISECETKGDYSYTIGLIDMAKALGYITQNEAAIYNSQAASNMQAAQREKKNDK